MRLWVDSEYAPELAVVSAWLVALVPWDVTYEVASVGSLLYVRFPLGQVRYAFGSPFGRAIRVQSPYGAWQFQAGYPVADAYAVWMAGAALVVAALLLSLLMYGAYGRVAPFRPVRAMGALLVVAGLVFAAASAVLWQHRLPGVQLPVGVAFQLAFGVVLLRAEYT